MNNDHGYYYGTTEEQTQCNKMINHNNHKSLDNKTRNSSSNKTMKNDNNKMNRMLSQQRVARIQLCPLPKSLFTISEDLFTVPNDCSDDDGGDKRKRNTRSNSSITYNTSRVTINILSEALENLSTLDDDDEIEEQEDEEKQQHQLLSSHAGVSRWNAEDTDSDRNSRSRSSSPVSSMLSLDRPHKRPIRRRDTAISLLATTCAISL
mmetsp:Transcript_43448/g.49183  ORF Transcript_43448/g.49183 Transcript_43448/m.49183 type:complete len:207 (-) Transcript_43448:75-695(-)